MKKKLFAMLLSLVMILSSVSILSEVSFAEGENEEAVVLNEEETIDLGEEKVPEAVGAPADFDLKLINTIAKTLENGQVKYYGIRTYGPSTNFDVIGEKTFYSLTRAQYDEVAKDCFMIFKEKDGKPFEISKARIGTNSITDTQREGTKAGSIFTELQFRHHMAYRYLISPGKGDPTSDVVSQKSWNWSIELKKDWIIEPYEGFGEPDSHPGYAYIHFNVDLDGKGYTIKRNDANDQGILQIGPDEADEPGSNKVVTIKNLNINGDDKYFGILTHKTTTLNLENVHISNCKTSLSDHGGGITLYNDTVLNMDAASSISNCKSNFGGAIYASGKVTVKININGSTLSNNQATYGGAIYSLKDTSEINIKNKAKLIENNSSSQGGAIYANSKLTIEDSEFTNNSTKYYGGAIMNFMYTTIKKSTFSKNNTSYDGGAIYQSGTSKLTIEDSNFTENECNRKGGAVFVNSKVTAKFEGATFIKNNATLEGGAIYTKKYKYEANINPATDYHNLDIDDKTTFTNNSARGYFNPPENVNKLTKIEFKRTSFTGTKKINPDSPLNNYDINYKRDIVVTYDPNDGNEAVEDKQTGQEVKGYEIKSVKDLKFTNTSKFLGWSEDKDSENPEYQAGQKVDLTGNLYLYAIWEEPAPKPSEPSTVILTLDENYRNGKITNIEVEEGDLIEPHLYIPRRRGYIFKGWSYDQKHLNEVKPGDRIYTDTTLYAIWKRAEVEKEEEPIEIKGEDHKTYIFGYPDGSVRPNGSITRAEAAAMLARLLNIEAIGSAAKPQFTDTESSWYNKAINAVVFRGIMKGYPDGRFRPNAPITRAEFTQMISTIDNKPYGVAPFADVPGHWAERAIGSEYQAKRITGYPDGLFRPDANITRAEAAVILNKIFERKYDNLSLLKCKNPQMIKRFTDLDETFWGWNDMVEATNTHEYVRRYKEDILKRLEEDWLLIKDINDIK